ncbi:hypothetical protein ACLKA6_002742 [Drosophila palustris]
MLDFTLAQCLNKEINRRKVSVQVWVGLYHINGPLAVAWMHQHFNECDWRSVQIASYRNCASIQCGQQTQLTMRHFFNLQVFSLLRFPPPVRLSMPPQLFPFD